MPQIKSPSKLAHFVVQTARFDEMRAFYKTFLGGHASYESEHLSFITYDDEHHRIGIIRNDQLKSKDMTTAGLVHVSFTFDTVQDLCEAYQQRKAIGMKPIWCVNHGPTISMYYADPDGNHIETQVDTCSTDEATAMMTSPDFMKNPIGADFDPDEFCRRVESGESEASLFKRADVGPRGPEQVRKLMQKIHEASSV